jgi:hypothetical protein
MNARAKWNAYADSGGRLAFWQWCAVVELLDRFGLTSGELFRLLKAYEEPGESEKGRE